MTKPRQIADDFVRDLSSALGDRLGAASLFGSAARGEWLEGISDVNVLVLVDRIDTTLLAAASPAAQAAVGHGVTPLLMEYDEWTRAADVFCIELADMRDASITLVGDDPVAGIDSDRTGLRLQAERELRAKLLHLHAGMLLAGDDRARLGQLLLHALPSFATYLRAALRLADRPVPGLTPDLIAAGCALISADPAAFSAVLEARRAGRLEPDPGDRLVDIFNEAAARLAAFIDNIGR